MPTFDLFSKRLKRQREENRDILQYDKLPGEFRVQVVHILKDALGGTEYNIIASYPGHSKIDSEEIFEAIHNVLCREYGLLFLPNPNTRGLQVFGPSQGRVFGFLLNEEKAERVLDAIELCFQVACRINDSYGKDAGVNISSDEAIRELNYRFLEHGIGYQFESGKIIRLDSRLIHAEVVKPTLAVLSEKDYQGANDEFLKAHEHFRHGRYKECLNECLKAFESTMKTICDKRKWQYSQRDTAKTLINTCFQNGLIPQYLQSHFASLRSSLESGIPTTRNRLGGHGQGTQKTIVPQYLAAYLLHLTATTILFLTKAEKELS